MRIKEYKTTFIFIIICHFIVSVVLALSFGTTHPLSGLYEANNCYKYVIISCLLTIIPYYFMGIIYIVGAEKTKRMKEIVASECYAFFAFLLLIYIICYALFYYNIVRGSFMYYVIANYPAGIILNSISLTKDGLNPIFALTTLPGPIGFYLGARSRLKYEENKGADKK